MKLLRVFLGGFCQGDIIIYRAASSLPIVHHTAQGGFKNSLAFTEAEGNPILLSLCGCFLAVATDAGIIKLYDVSKRAKIDASTLPVRRTNKVAGFSTR